MHTRLVIVFLCILVSVFPTGCANSSSVPEPQPPNATSPTQLPSDKSVPKTSSLTPSLPEQNTSRSVSPANQIDLQIVSVTSPVLADSNATVVIQTVPSAECSITVNYKSGPSKANGLNSKTADSTGKVTWTWKVGSKTTPGTWQIQIKATCNGKTAIQTAYFTVR
ncbi:MAG: hypothetical protein ABSB31_08945 [Dehalococcoidia bacterium]|jgi:hypothetical protein